MLNVSEGRDRSVLDELAEACGEPLLDVHRDPDHNRSVFTLAGPSVAVEAAARTVARRAIEILDLRRHDGAHPRLGVVDVVPFVPLRRRAPGQPFDLSNEDLAPAIEARDRFAHWAAEDLGVPSFLYGPLPGGKVRRLPEIRRGAFGALGPDVGPPRPHPTAGALSVGARGFLVAYNLWTTGGDLRSAREVAASLRSPHVRTMVRVLSGSVQISANLVNPAVTGPAAFYDAARAGLAARGMTVRRAELVGLLPLGSLRAIDPERWASLDLGPDRTLEHRLDSQAPCRSIAGRLPAGPGGGLRRR